MTADDIKRLTPLVEDLQKRGIVATYSTTSWLMGGLANRGLYEHAFQIRGHRAALMVVLTEPFTESHLMERLAAAEARQNHSAAVEGACIAAKERVLANLATVYLARMFGSTTTPAPFVTVPSFVIQLA